MSLAVYVLVMVLITSGLLILDWLLERREIHLRLRLQKRRRPALPTPGALRCS